MATTGGEQDQDADTGIFKRNVIIGDDYTHFTGNSKCCQGILKNF